MVTTPCSSEAAATTVPAHTKAVYRAPAFTMMTAYSRQRQNPGAHNFCQKTRFINDGLWVFDAKTKENGLASTITLLSIKASGKVNRALLDQSPARCVWNGSLTIAKYAHGNWLLSDLHAVNAGAWNRISPPVRIIFARILLNIVTSRKVPMLRLLDNNDLRPALRTPQISVNLPYDLVIRGLSPAVKLTVRKVPAPPSPNCTLGFVLGFCAKNQRLSSYAHVLFAAIRIMGL